MKMPIEWHESCLKNAKRSLREKEAYLDQFLDNEARSIERLRNEIERTEQQIAEAKRRGKDGFDAERFLKGRERR